MNYLLIWVQIKKEPFRHSNIYTYPIIRLFKWFLFGENQKIEQLQLLYIKTSIVDINVQFLKKQVNKLIIWPTALPIQRLTPLSALK